MSRNEGNLRGKQEEHDISGSGRNENGREREREQDDKNAEGKRGGEELEARAKRNTEI